MGINRSAFQETLFLKKGQRFLTPNPTRTSTLGKDKVNESQGQRFLMRDCESSRCPRTNQIGIGLMRRPKLRRLPTHAKQHKHFYL